MGRADDDNGTVLRYYHRRQQCSPLYSDVFPPLPVRQAAFTTIMSKQSDDSSFCPFKIGVVPSPSSILQVDPNQGAVWTRTATNVSYACIIVEKDLATQRAKFARSLLSDVIPECFDCKTKCLKDPLGITMMLRNRIDLLLSNDDIDLSEKANLLKSLSLPPTLWFQTPADMRRGLREYKKRTFEETKVFVFVCNRFLPRMLFKVDISFLPSDFFCCDDKVTRTLHDLGIQTNEMYQTHLNFKEELRGNMMQTMKFEQESRTFDFLYGGPPYLTSFYFNVLLPGVLREVGNAIPNSVSDDEISILFRDYKRLGYLLTVKEKLQSPHVDIEHETIRITDSKLGRKGVVDKSMPWSFDLPQNQGGLRLAVWGTEYPQSPDEGLYATPLDINVHGKELLLWRGDLIHGGCLAGPSGELGALRQHGFMPLHREQTGMYVYGGDKKSGRLGNKCRSGDRCYDAFLNGLDGVPFE